MAIEIGNKLVKAVIVVAAIQVISLGVGTCEVHALVRRWHYAHWLT
jgi:hypothetical protein